jgi:hypothetical protein
MHRIRLLVVAAAVLMVPAYGVAQERVAEPAIVFDAYLTPITGALNLLSLQRTLGSLEDRFLPQKLGAERTRLGLLGGIAYRAAKFIALDVPQDHMFLVVQHEVFGHGARLREIGRGRIEYGFDVPIPYGPGGGVTRFDGEFPDSPLAVLAIESSGIEGQHTLADAIAARALSRGRLRYREAWLYFESRYVAATYILDATEFAEEGHDVGDFVRTMAEACKTPACKPITLSDLQRGAKWMLADPLLYVSLYGFASAYIGMGQSSTSIPMLPLGPRLRYLPSVGFQMTPYGTEWSVRNQFVNRAQRKGQTADGTRERVTAVTLRVGNTGATRPWAVDVHTSGIRVPRTRWRIDPSLSVWRQPFILASQTSAPLETGAAASATFVVPLPHQLRVAPLSGIYITAGAKSEGFVPGEQLSGGAIFKAGLTLRPFD